MSSTQIKRGAPQRLDIGGPVRAGLVVVLALLAAALFAVTRAPFEAGAALAEVRIVDGSAHDVVLPAGFGVARMLVGDGQDVAAGDVIAVPDAAAIDAQTAALKVQAAAIERRLDLVRSEAQGFSELLEQRLAESNKLVALLGQLAELERSSVEILARIARAEQQLTQQDIRAPVSGKVTLVAAKTSAQAASLDATGPSAQAVTVARIVPRSGRLLVEARLPPREAQAWQIGQQASVWLNGLSWLEGRPSRARLAWLESGSDADTGAAYVTARLELDVAGALFAAALADVPGLRGGLLLHEGQLTLLQQLLEPIRRNFNRSSRA